MMDIGSILAQQSTAVAAVGGGVQPNVAQTDAVAQAATGETASSQHAASNATQDTRPLTGSVVIVLLALSMLWFGGLTIFRKIF